MNDYSNVEVKRASALFMASRLELNATGFDKLKMNTERDECLRKATEIRAKWGNS